MHARIKASGRIARRKMGVSGRTMSGMSAALYCCG
jgi:hypothetical protein